ncbi:hypothetical protein SAMN05660772_01337 [Pasteurella testudinis DSM 23072]|uniref:Serine hydrolase family protein n=1 Tax=Pasteurella testudinis DSM 23072 TaxID=1122938 RepID=A0A1W1V844_9PAST|nr:alpha/beta fold hydrolase [Pasteurella testudinis]SMB89528.1 hypothetical protein SAMN05660772_01337 [Pasteurella testudinis DSM 23072]SUB52020.1 Putative hydrolase ydeN [Pasteurella testudinis]
MAKPHIYIVHGYTASVDSNWFPWLKTTLENKGITTTVLPMPESHNPNDEAWLAYLKNNITISKNTILVGHSLGCIAILKYVEQLPITQKIRGVVLVSGFAEKVDTLPELDQFNQNPTNYHDLIIKIQTRIVIASLNDEIVPYHYSERLKERLQAEYYTLQNGGHFLDRDGFSEFPLVYEQITKITN